MTMKISNHPMMRIKSFEENYEEITAVNVPPVGAPSIPEFYSDQEIFITGASGFIGKALMEKLLRSCPEIKTIYALMRPKKGKNIEQRLTEILQNPVFDVIRIKDPNFHLKIVPVTGDVAELKLGMSAEDTMRLKGVSIIFHSAASVRFDDSLKYAVLMNTRGTRELMEFATGLTNLKSLVHVSTTYSNVYTHTLEEELYPPVADWKKTIEICEKLDEDQVQIVVNHYINFMPNTYVFSKNLAEHVTNEYKHKLPVTLFRPSVVVSAMKEPLPGMNFIKAYCITTSFNLDVNSK
jgi:alcohol-forming fatty acyl-CoA reductase